MKMLWILAASAVLAFNVLSLVPALQEWQTILIILALVAGAASLAGWILENQEKTPPPPVQAAQPTVATPKNQAEAEIVALLGMLQDKGRLIDFLMDDIAAYEDAQVGAAARVVHQGCQSVLKDHFLIEAIATETEGQTLTLPAGYPADDFRLSGKVEGQAPFTGKLLHKGWRAKSVKLPRVLNTDGRLPVIAPAQVQLS